MATIAENLKRILSAVYGKDVRQAIHDSIEQCHQKVSNAYSVVNDIVNKLSVPVKYDIVAGKVWRMLTMGDPGLIEKMEANAYCECAQISVNPGDTYYIQVYSDPGGAAYKLSDQVMFAYEKNAGSGNWYKHPESNYPEPNYSDSAWMVTAPESDKPMCLLVYSTGANHGGISEIRKMRV